MTEPALIALNVDRVRVTKTSTEVLPRHSALGRGSDYVTKMVDPNPRDKPRQVSPHCFADQCASDMVAEAINN